MEGAAGEAGGLVRRLRDEPGTQSYGALLGTKYQQCQHEMLCLVERTPGFSQRRRPLYQAAGKANTVIIE